MTRSAVNTLPPDNLLPVAFFNRGEDNYQTGGYLYNQKIREALCGQGRRLSIYDSAQTLAAISDETLVVIDSLLMPELAQTVVTNNIRPILLYHLPPDFSLGSSNNWIKLAEQQSHIVVTGDVSYHHMQNKLKGRYLSLHKIEPGVHKNWQQKNWWPDKPHKLLMVASYQPGKGFERLPNALTAVKSLPWSLDIIGEDRLSPIFKTRLYKELKSLGLADRVNLHGPKSPSEINQAMLAADLLLQCSSFETYSMVTAEAIACGLPVISTPTGNQKSFSQSGRVRYLETFETHELGDALRQLLKSPMHYQNLCGPAPLEQRSWVTVQGEFLTILPLSHQGKRHDIAPTQIMTGAT